MKKPVAILLLLIGGAASCALAAIMTIIVFVILSFFIPEGGEWALFAITALFAYALSYIECHPRAYLKKNYGVGSAAFVALACVPELIASAVVYFVHTPVISEETGKDIMKVRLLLWLIVSAAFALSLVIRAVTDAIKYKIEHRPAKALSEIDVDAEEDE